MNSTTLRKILTALTFATFLGCATQPEGPAERLGRDIDQIIKDVNYANEQYSPSPEPTPPVEEVIPPEPGDYLGAAPRKERDKFYREYKKRYPR